VGGHDAAGVVSGVKRAWHRPGRGLERAAAPTSKHANEDGQEDDCLRRGGERQKKEGRRGERAWKGTTVALQLLTSPRYQECQGNLSSRYCQASELALPIRATAQRLPRRIETRCPAKTSGVPSTPSPSSMFAHIYRSRSHAPSCGRMDCRPTTAVQQQNHRTTVQHYNATLL